MSAQLRPNRLVVNDRFPMLGFTIRTDGTPQRAEITIATEPALFADVSRRTTANFFSTSELGPLSVPNREAVYVVSPQILTRFVGADRLYFALATAPAANGESYTVQIRPEENSPYVSIGGLTGRSLSRVRMFPRRGRRPMQKNGYGTEGAAGLHWAGDVPAPGMEHVDRGANGSTEKSNTSQHDAVKTPTENSRIGMENGDRTAANGNGSEAANGGNGTAPEMIDYDDGFGPLPALPVPANGTTTVTPPTAQSLGLDSTEIGEMQAVDAPTASKLGTIAGTAAQVALAANPVLTTTVVAARAAAELGDVSVGVGPAVSGGFLVGAQLGVGIIFAPGNRLGYYGSEEGMLGAIASLSLTVQITVLRGGISSFDGISYAAGFSAGEGVVGGASVIFDSQRRFLGVSFQVGVGVGLSPFEVYVSVQRQVAAQLGWATAFGTGSVPAYAMIIGPDDVERAQRYAPAWRDLFNWSVPISVANAVSSRGMSIQRIQDAHGTLNLDRYEVRCSQLPGGYSAESLLDHMRRNMNHFVDMDNTEFDPYSSADETQWSGASPVGSVFNLDIIGPDNAAVVCSLVQAKKFRFTTITTPNTGSHPVSGHREFGVRSEGDAHVFYTRGADRSTHGMGETIVFAGADHLWKSFQELLSEFINDNGGSATILPRFSKRFHPDVVRILYGRKSSAQARTLGAGHDPYAVEVKYRMFIPSPVIEGPPLMDDYGGDGRSFSYDGGTSRGEITAIVHLSSGLGIDSIDVQDRHWGESTAYDSDDTFHVSGKPDWWFDKKAGAQPTERATLQVEDDNLKIYAGTSGQRGIRVMAENASAVTVAAAGALPLSSIAPDINADVSILFRNHNGLIQVMALGKHDGFPAHELYVNGEIIYRYNPVAAGNGPGTLVGFGDIDVASDWKTVARTYTVRTGSQAQAQSFDESFTVNWDEVESIPQPTDMSCWAAAGAMLLGWRDQVSLTPATIAEFTGRTTKTGLDAAEIGDFANDLGLEAEHPQSYSQSGFRQLLEDNGPLWVAAAVPPNLHAIVVTGIYNDDTQLYVRITDPWDRTVGTPGAPGAYAKTHTTGSRYILTWEDFVAEYHAAATNFSNVNLQILHSGGTNGRQPNTGGTTPAGYAQAYSVPMMEEAATELNFAVSPTDAVPPTLQILAPPTADKVPVTDRWHTLVTETFGAEMIPKLAGLPELAAQQGWSIGVSYGAQQGLALNSAIGSGIGVGSNRTFFRFGIAPVSSNGLVMLPVLVTVVSGGTDAFSAWSQALPFASQDPHVPTGAVLLNDMDLPVGIAFLVKSADVPDITARIVSMVDTVQTAHAAVAPSPTPAAPPSTDAQAFSAQAVQREVNGMPPIPGLPAQPDAFPPPGVKIFRSQVENNGVNYDLFLMDGTVIPQMPAQVAQSLIPGEQVVVADWPYIDGPGGRAQGGVAIDWSYGAGAVANVRLTPSGGQSQDGWRISVHSDIGPGPSTPTETQLKVTIRTTFSRNGEPDQTGVSEVILAGSGQHQTAHREDAETQMVAA